MNTETEIETLISVRVSPGSEGQDWGSELLGMYSSWAKKKGYRVAYPKKSSGELFIAVAGAGVYERLRSEAGVHRRVRISPYDSEGRRHTSFATVSVSASDADGAGEVSTDEILRSYVLDPYTSVTDHRSGVKTDDVEAVLGGELDLFLEA